MATVVCRGTLLEIFRISSFQIKTISFSKVPFSNVENKFDIHLMFTVNIFDIFNFRNCLFSNFRNSFVGDVQFPNYFLGIFMFKLFIIYVCVKNIALRVPSAETRLTVCRRFER